MTFYLETRKPRGKKLTQVACGGYKDKETIINYVHECKKHSHENGFDFVYVLTLLPTDNYSDKEVIEI